MKLDAEEQLLEQAFEKGDYVESTDLELAETKNLLKEATTQYGLLAQTKKITV